MPRKIKPKRYFTPCFMAAPRTLSASAAAQLREVLGERANTFIQRAPQLVHRYRVRARIWAEAPRLAEVRAALDELREHAAALTHGLDALDGDSFEFVHAALAAESFGGPAVPPLEGLDVDKLDNPQAVERMLRDSEKITERWVALQELFERVVGEAQWLLVVVDHAGSLLPARDKPGPNLSPVHWLADAIADTLRDAGIESPSSEFRGLVESALRCLLEESGADRKLWEDGDLRHYVGHALTPKPPRSTPLPD
jgi:hypothetical protein